MKNVALLTEDGTFALLFRPHLGEFDSSKVPTPGNLPSKAKKGQCPGLSPEEGGWWNWLMHYEKINPSEWQTGQCAYRVFPLTWPASIQMYWNKRKRLHKKRVQLLQDWFGTPTWPPFHCFWTPTWPPWRHVKTLYSNTTDKFLIHEARYKSITVHFPYQFPSSTLFWYILLSYIFFEKMSNVFSFTFFSLPLICTLHRWLLALVTAATNFSYCSCNKKMFPLFFLSLALDLCHPFSRWVSLACCLLFLLLCLSSCSIFQICGHDN